jgi:hypothetical protein
MTVCGSISLDAWDERWRVYIPAVKQFRFLSSRSRADIGPIAAASATSALGNLAIKETEPLSMQLRVPQARARLETACRVLLKERAGTVMAP